MRIGILTYFWEDNPGQYFQALATQQILEQAFRGHRVELTLRGLTGIVSIGDVQHPAEHLP